MPSPASGKKVERIIPSEVRETRTDKYPMISLPGINCRWIQMSLLPETQPRRLRRETSGQQDIKMWRMEERAPSDLYAHYD